LRVASLGAQSIEFKLPAGIRYFSCSIENPGQFHGGPSTFVLPCALPLTFALTGPFLLGSLLQDFEAFPLLAFLLHSSGPLFSNPLNAACHQVLASS
jgi:hypothetical protein